MIQFWVSSVWIYHLKNGYYTFFFCSFCNFPDANIVVLVCSTFFLGFNFNEWGENWRTKFSTVLFSNVKFNMNCSLVVARSKPASCKKSVGMHISRQLSSFNIYWLHVVCTFNILQKIIGIWNAKMESSSFQIDIFYCLLYLPKCYQIQGSGCKKMALMVQWLLLLFYWWKMNRTDDISHLFFLFAK